MSRKQFKELEGEEIYKDLFDNAHDLIHFVNIDGSIIYVNRSWMQVLGYSIEEIKGKSIYSFIKESDRKKFEDYRKQVIDGTAQEKEILITTITKSGKEVRLEGFISVKHHEGKPVYTRGIFRDVSLRIQNEQKIRSYTEELKEREYNLQQLLKYAPDAIIVIDAESKIIFWNPKAEEIFGWTSEEVTGSSLHDKIIPPVYREAHISGMRRYLATGEAHVLNKSIDITALKKDGTEFYVSLTISTTSQNGKTAFIAFIRDITPQKTNEIELEKKRQELEKSNKELEQFAYAASHDMQEPLRKIRTFASFLMDHAASKLNEFERSYLQKIDASSHRMKNIIDDLLNYSHHTRERKFEKMDLQSVVQNAVKDLELMIEQKKASVSWDQLPEIEAIPVQIEQLFYNLINNSLKFSNPSVQPVVHIGCSNCNSNDSFAEIFIRDNGIGIDPRYAEKIFMLFHRLNDRKSYEGTGIGLALCKKIVENHKGEIWVKSNEGEGSTFFIRLPIRQTAN